MTRNKVTHLSLYNASGRDLPLGWFIRFSGNDTEFNAMREDLKSQGVMSARWCPTYQWNDGKKGAWWVASMLFMHRYEDRFYGMDGSSGAMEAVLDELLINNSVYQWIVTREGYYNHVPYELEQEPANPIPAYLQGEYKMLEIGVNANLADAKEAYRKLAKVYHPDAGGTHNGFIALQKAYEMVVKYISLKESEIAS